MGGRRCGSSEIYSSSLWLEEGGGRGCVCEGEGEGMDYVICSVHLAGMNCFSRWSI